MPLTPKRKRALKHKLREMYFNKVVIQYHNKQFDRTEAREKYLELVEKIQLIKKDEDKKEFMAFAKAVFRMMPKEFDHLKEQWESLQREYEWLKGYW